MPDTSGGSVGVNISGVRSLGRAIGRAISGRSSNSATGAGDPLLNPGSYTGPPVRLNPVGGFTDRTPTAATTQADVSDAWSGPTSGAYGSTTRKRRASGRKKKKREWWEICPTMQVECVRENWAEVQASWTNQMLLQQLPSIGMATRGSAAGLGRTSATTKFIPKSPKNVLTAAGNTVFPTRGDRVIGNVVHTPSKLDWNALANPSSFVSPPFAATADTNPTTKMQDFWIRKMYLRPIEPVKVTAQKVGRITAPAPDDRYALADAVGESAPVQDVAAAAETQDYEFDRRYLNAWVASRQPGDSGSGPAITARSAAGSAGTATKPATGTVSTRSRAAVALSNLFKIELPLDALAKAIVPRSRNQGASSRSLNLGRVTGATGTSPATSPAAFLTGYAPAQARSRTKQCECDKPKRKPRKPRSVCYKGSYTESAFGLSKRKREQVPC
jgi:hypothetical protein